MIMIDKIKKHYLAEITKRGHLAALAEIWDLGVLLVSFIEE